MSSERQVRESRGRRPRSWIASVAATCLAFAAAPGAPAQDAAATRMWRSEGGSFSIPLPANWEVESNPTEATPGGPRHSFLIQLGGGRTVDVSVCERSDIRNRRGRLVYDLAWDRSRGARREGRCDHTVANGWAGYDADARLPANRRLHAFRHVRRTALTLTADVPDTHWDRMWRPLLDAFAKADTALEDSPRRPPGMRPFETSGILFLLGKGVEQSAAETLLARVKSVEARREAVHGPVPRDPENRPEIVICRTREEAIAAQASTGWKEESESGVVFIDMLGRIITWAFPASNAGARSDFDYAVWWILHAQAFDREPGWLAEAEAFAAWLEACCGKPLPAVPANVLEPLPDPAPRFSELAVPDPPVDGRTFDSGDRSALVGYLAAFRFGSVRTQAAWKQFLAEMRESGDWNKAQKPLLALDQDALRSEMALELSKLKGVRVQ